MSKSGKLTFFILFLFFRFCPAERLCDPRSRLLLEVIFLRQPEALRQRRRPGVERHASEHPGQVNATQTLSPGEEQLQRSKVTLLVLFSHLRSSLRSLAADSYEWGSQSSGISAYIGGGDESYLANPPEQLGHYWQVFPLTCRLLPVAFCTWGRAPPPPLQTSSFYFHRRRTNSSPSTPVRHWRHLRLHKPVQSHLHLYLSPLLPFTCKVI